MRKIDFGDEYVAIVEGLQASSLDHKCECGTNQKALKNG